MSKLLEQIVGGNLCHGCGGCVAIAGPGAVEMRMNDAGYLRPEPVGILPGGYDERLDQVCSGRRIVQQPQASAPHANWGPLITVEAGHATDPGVRFRGSSGGVLSAIAIHLLEAGLVDAVIHASADPQDPVGNVTRASRDRDEIMGAAGSRYAPSSPLADLEAHLASGGRYAFIGKPCDLATLRALARHDPRIDAQIPYKLSFFCAGVPSRKGAQALLRAMGVEPGELARFDFRGNGWPGVARAVRHDGTEATMDYAASWGAVLSRHLQFRCKICPDGVGAFADIVAADAWYGRDGYPDFEERDGRSLVIARTKAGRALLDSTVGQGKILLNPLPVREIALMQPYQVSRKRAVLARCLALLLLGRMLPRYSGLQLVRNVLRASPLWLVRNMLGTLRRLPRTPKGA